MPKIKINEKQVTLDFSIGQAVDYSTLSNNIHYYTTKFPLDILEAIRNNKKVSFDIETYGLGNDGLRSWAGSIRLLQFGTQDGQVYIFDLRDLKEAYRTKLIDFTKELMANKKIEKILHNGKFDLAFINHQLGIEVVNFVFDTYITSILLYSGIVNTAKRSLYRFGLGYCVERELGIAIDKSNQLSDWGAANLSIDQLEYAAKDVSVLFDLANALRNKANKMDMKMPVFIENNYVPVVARMQCNGMVIDVEKTKAALQAHIDCRDAHEGVFRETFPYAKMGGSGLLAKINEMYGEELKHSRYDSLFERQQGDKPEKIALRQQRILPELTADVLLTIAPINQAFYHLGKARSLEKHINYLQAMLDNQRNGRVYTNYGQLSVTSLGRTSSGAAVGKKKGGTAKDGINLQNSPKPIPDCPREFDDKFNVSEEYAIRACFLVDIISDLSAAHSKVAVQVSQDKVSIDVENNGGDIHLFTAATIAEMQGLPLTFDEMMAIKKDSNHPAYKEVKQLRELAKNVRYSSFNLGGAKRLQQTCAKKGINFSLQECKDAIKAWRIVHADIYNFQMDQLAVANNYDLEINGLHYGAIRSHGGAIHHLIKFPSKFKPDVLEVNAADCMSVIWMQTEAMVMKKAAILVQREFDEHPEWSAQINNLCHDELNAMACDEYIDAAAECVHRHMKECMEHYVSVVPVASEDHTEVYMCEPRGEEKRRIKTWLDK